MLMDTVTEAYLAFAIMTLVGIGFPVGAFIASYFLRPIEDPNDKTKVRSILLPGYERDHSLYPRAATTYECGAEPSGRRTLTSTSSTTGTPSSSLCSTSPSCSWHSGESWPSTPQAGPVGGDLRTGDYVDFRPPHESRCLARIPEEGQNLHLR